MHFSASTFLQYAMVHIMQLCGAIWDKFVLNFKTEAGTAPFGDVIWDEFSEQH